VAAADLAAGTSTWNTHCGRWLLGHTVLTRL